MFEITRFCFVLYAFCQFWDNYFMSRFTPEEAEKINKENHEKNARDFKDFKKDLAAGKCWVCKESLSNFDETKPCQHWLLKPDGFRKKHFKILFAACTYDKLEGFLRWYVNAHLPFQGINDLKEEHDGSKLRALTIKHDNLEWSFSFSQSCLEGKYGNHGPHYHFQMRVDGRPFFDYGNYHIKLSDYELWLLDIDQGKNPDFKRIDTHGMGMEGVFNDIEPEVLLDGMRRTDDMDKATFHLQTMVEAEPGKTISGDDIADLIEESKSTGVPLAKLVKRLKGVKTRVYIEPGDGVPKPAQRTPSRKKKK
jgi:hypothetical protein